MNSFKNSETAKHIEEWHIERNRLRLARIKAEKEHFKHKVQANLILGVALIVIFCVFFWN